MTTSEAFDAAVLDGDLATIEAFFAQRHVQQDVAETDAFVLETTPHSVHTATRRDGSVPWFRRLAQYHSDPTVVPLVSAARSGHAHVLAYFFSQYSVARMAGTLALLLSDVVALGDDTRDWRVPTLTHAAHVLETVLSSFAFHHVLSVETQQRLLDDVVCFSRSEERVRVAIAHGARVDTPSTLEAQAAYLLQYIPLDQRSMLELLVDEGLCVVGADVLHLSAQHSNPWSGVRLIELGAASGNTTTKPLLVLAAGLSDRWFDYEGVLRAGFHDVDTRGEHGETALMVAAACPRIYYDDAGEVVDDPGREYAEALMRCGADVHAVDYDGRTAREYAYRAGNDCIAELLEEENDDAEDRAFGFVEGDTVDRGTAPLYLIYDRCGLRPLPRGRPCCAEVALMGAAMTVLALHQRRWIDNDTFMIHS